MRLWGFAMTLNLFFESLFKLGYFVFTGLTTVDRVSLVAFRDFTELVLTLLQFGLQICAITFLLFDQSLKFADFVLEVLGLANLRFFV